MTSVCWYVEPIGPGPAMHIFESAAVFQGEYPEQKGRFGKYWFPIATITLRFAPVMKHSERGRKLFDTTRWCVPYVCYQTGRNNVRTCVN